MKGGGHSGIFPRTAASTHPQPPSNPLLLSLRVLTRSNSTDHVPTGDDIARFLESISDKLQPAFLDKPAISLHVFRKAVIDICDGLTFKHEFQLSRHEGKRIDTLLDALVREGKLTTGTWRRRERVGFFLVRLGSART